MYLPVAHMVWYAEGYLFAMGALDFAGGTVVHINAGIAALVGAIVLGPRIGYGREVIAPHSLVMTLIGAGLLWVGWFGFNAGSNLEATVGTDVAPDHHVPAGRKGLGPMAEVHGDRGLRRSSHLDGRGVCD